MLKNKMILKGIRNKIILPNIPKTKALEPKCSEINELISYKSAEEIKRYDITSFQNPQYVLSMLSKKKKESGIDDSISDDYRKEALQVILSS